MTKTTISQEAETNQEVKKADGRWIEDEFKQIERVAYSLKALRDGFTGANGKGELWAWNIIADMSLEYELGQLNQVLMNLHDTFEGLEYKPIKTNGYSCLRSSNIFDEMDEYEAKLREATGGEV